MTSMGRNGRSRSSTPFAVALTAGAALMAMVGCSGSQMTPPLPTTLTATWKGGSVPGTTLNLALVQTGTSLSGTGAVGVSPAIPAATGPGTPPTWNGDMFTITSGSVSGSTVTFTSTQFGSNPGQNGGVYYGSMKFVGTQLNDTSITGTITYVPPITVSYTWAQQSAVVTMSRLTVILARRARQNWRKFVSQSAWY